MSMCFIYLIHSRLCGIRTTEGLSEVDICSYRYHCYLFMYFISILGIQIDHKKANVFLESEGLLVRAVAGVMHRH